MRHAQAVASVAGIRDFDRTLDDHGYAQAELAANRAADLGYIPECLISSTAVRCRQTAEIVRKALGETIDIEFIDDLYNGTPEVYATVVAGRSPARSAMLIGHNPSIDQFLEALIGKAARSAALPGGYPTGTITVLDRIPAEVEASTGWSLTDIVTG